MKKFTYNIAFLFSLLACQITYGQNTSAEIAPTTENQIVIKAGDYPNLGRQLKEVNQAMVSGDFAKVVYFTHSKVVEMGGGKDKMIASIKTEFEQMKVDGFIIEAVTIGEITQIAKVDNEIFAVVPITWIMKMPDGKFAGEAALVGISNDSGANWKFINGINQQRFQILFPKAAEKLQIPDEKPPQPVGKK